MKRLTYIILIFVTLVFTGCFSEKKSPFYDSEWIMRNYDAEGKLYYHHLMRCKKAKELLIDSRLSISQVGESAGFVTSSHFSHIFRKMEGCTPSEYRKRHQTDPERTEK